MSRTDALARQHEMECLTAKSLTKKQEETDFIAHAVAMEDPFTDCKQEEMHITAYTVARRDVY